MNIEDRLRDALEPYRDQDVPQELWDRVEAGTRGRHTRVLPLALVAAVILLVFAVVGAVTLRRSEPSHEVTAAGVTLEQFVETTNRQCTETKARLDAAVVVFRTPTAYAAVADQLLSIAQNAVATAQVAAIPPDLHSLALTNIADLRAAVAAAERARSAAGSGDTDAAQRAIDDFNIVMSRVGNRLAAAGATGCAP